MAAEYGSISPDPDLEFDDRPATVGIPPKWVFPQARSRIEELIFTVFDYYRPHNKMLQAPSERISFAPRFSEEIEYVDSRDLQPKSCGRTKFGEVPLALNSCGTEYGDPKVGRGNVMGAGRNSHPGVGGGGGGTCRHDHGGHLPCGAGHDVDGHDGHITYPCLPGSGGGGAGSGGRTSFAVGALTDAPLERILFLLMSAAVYFATLGFINTIIARNVRGGSNGTRSIITHLAKGNHVFFQMFTLVNIFGFATSSGALLIRVDKRKLKSGVMFLTCSIIASLCMALSLSVLVVLCVLVSLDALAVTGFNG